MQAVVHTTTRHTIVKVTPYCPRHSCFGHAYISNVSAQWRTRTHQDIVQTASPWFDIGQARWYHRCTFDIKRLLSEHDSAAVSRCLARLPPPQRVVMWWIDAQSVAINWQLPWQRKQRWIIIPKQKKQHMYWKSSRLQIRSHGFDIETAVCGNTVHLLLADGSTKWTCMLLSDFISSLSTASHWSLY